MTSKATLSSLAAVATLLIFGLSALAPAAITLTPSDNRTVSDLTTAGALNTVDVGAISGTYIARTRTTDSQNDRQVASFLKFDLSGLTASQVNDAGFSAKFQIDFVSRLNAVNSGLDISLGRNVSGNWNSGGTANPLHDWGWDDETNSIIADEIGVLVTEVRFAPLVNDIELDVTDEVKDWVNGVNDNWGFVVFGKDEVPQGGGFNNAELIIVPEPSSTFLLAVLGLLGLLRRRR